MIQKETVISWFKGLPGDDRIDLMCNLLDCSLPLEIRFFSTFLEAHVQRDYPVFRQAESTANNPTDLSCLLCLDVAHVRRKLCVCLGLLHSSNRQAAAVLFGILNDYQPSTLAEEEFFTELSLLMTMSAHHPAFSFHQKHTLQSKLKQIKQSANRTSDLSETVSESSSGSSTFSFDQDVPVKFDVQDDLCAEQHTKDTETVRKVPERLANRHQSPEVYIKELKVQAIEKIKEKKSRHDLRKRDDHRYVLQVSWCDDTMETIHKTYEEMFDFQCKLRKMYPIKVDANGNPWKLPFLPGRIRIFNKPDQKGEKTPIPDITDYIRLFSSLPKFVRGCDHVVKFFQCNKRSRKKSETKKSKIASKKEEQQPDKVCKHKEFETPHRIAEAVRDQSLGGKDTNSKKKTVGTAKYAKKQSENNLPGENLTNEQYTDGEPLAVDVDENGNDVKTLLPGASPFKPPFSSAVSDNTLHKFGSNGLLHTSAETSLVSLHVNLPSYPSPSPSPIGSPVTSPTGSPSFPHRPCPSNINWAFRRHGRALNVYEWLRRLRLHKYFDVFRGKTFDEMLKLSDEDFEKLGLTAGARRKLRVNLEVLRNSGCFTSDGLTVVDMAPSTPSDLTQLHTLNSAHSKGILMSPNFPISSVHLPLCYSSDSEFLRSESDSASDCGSDVLSEPSAQTDFCSTYPKKCPVLNSCRLSCYNCGSLGHVGGQCMAPNLDKRISSGYHFKYEAHLE